MVLTQGQIIDLFENADKMGILERRRIQLEEEGIDLPDNLMEFDKDSLDLISGNLKHPGGQCASRFNNPYTTKCVWS